MRVFAIIMVACGLAACAAEQESPMSASDELEELNCDLSVTYELTAETDVGALVEAREYLDRRQEELERCAELERQSTQ